jgi:hypothetical protein
MRVRFALWAGGLGASALVLLSAACGGGSQNSGAARPTVEPSATALGGPAPTPNAQEAFARRLVSAHDGLPLGTLSETRLGSIPVGGLVKFQVTISVDATATVTRPASGAAATPTAVSTAVKVGGMTGVQAFCHGVTCTAQSSTRQGVVAGISGVWTWSLTATQPGTATISIVATTYSLDTDVVLAESSPLDQTVLVSAGTGYQVRRVAGWVKGVGIGGIVSAAAGAGRFVVWWRKRRTKHRLEAAAASAAPAPGAAADHEARGG